MISKIFRLTILVLSVAAVFWGISLVSQWYLDYQQENSIYIALAGPMSGTDHESGNQIRQGVELALTEVNEAGGINGHPVKLLVFDDQNNVKVASQVAQNVVASRALAVVGHMYSGTSVAAGRPQ